MLFMVVEAGSGACLCGEGRSAPRCRVSAPEVSEWRTGGFGLVWVGQIGGWWSESRAFWRSGRRFELRGLGGAREEVERGGSSRALW